MWHFNVFGVFATVVERNISLKMKLRWNVFFGRFSLTGFILQSGVLKVFFFPTCDVRFVENMNYTSKPLKEEHFSRQRSTFIMVWLVAAVINFFSPSHQRPIKFFYCVCFSVICHILSWSKAKCLTLPPSIMLSMEICFFAAFINHILKGMAWKPLQRDLPADREGLGWLASAASTRAKTPGRISVRLC